MVMATLAEGNPFSPLSQQAREFFDPNSDRWEHK